MRPAPPRRVDGADASDETPLGDDDITYVPDEEPTSRAPSRRPPPLAVPSLRATGQNWPLVPALALAPPQVPTFGPPPSAEATIAPAAAIDEPVGDPAPAAVIHTSPEVPPPPPSATAWAPLTAAPLAPVAASAWHEEGPAFSPTGTDLDVDDAVELPLLSPMAAFRSRVLQTWGEASPNARAALTFAAGIVVGAVGVALT